MKSKYTIKYFQLFYKVLEQITDIMEVRRIFYNKRNFKTLRKI